MKIKYFSWIKNITNTGSEELNSKNITDIKSLKFFLCEKYPKLDEYINGNETIRIAINYEYSYENCKISNKDEVALFPPVSGG